MSTDTPTHTSQGLTARGRATIDVLRLGEVSDEIEHHLRTAVLPRLEAVEEHCSAGRKAAGIARWSTLLSDTLAPASPLSAATWCALEVWMPAARRRRWRLQGPRRPGR